MSEMCDFRVLEPTVLTHNNPENETALYSIAISLKRIADALDPSNQQMNIADMISFIEMNTRKN